MSVSKNLIAEVASTYQTEIEALSSYIFRNPETGFHEYLSSKAVCELLKKYGFTVNEGCAGMETAFRAEYRSGKEGPVLGFLCEYDALPELGHACGHNLIAASSAGAALISAHFAKTLGGTIVVLGTPSEEGGGGGKAILQQKGFMDDLSCAMMIHPGFKTMAQDRFLSISQFRYVFHGKSAHTGNAQAGKNALSAVIQMFVGVDSLRPTLDKSASVFGIISNGGVAPNIIPEIAEAEFCIRADQKATLHDTVSRVNQCAQAAAMIYGCTVSIESIGETYDDMVPNQTLAAQLAESYKIFGLEVSEKKPGEAMGSTDAGNLSYHMPVIHGMISLGDSEAALHTTRFRELAGSIVGTEKALLAAKCLSMTAVRLIEDPEILRAAWAEYKDRLKA